MDPFFRVEVLSQTPNPQQVIYAAMHQDYSEKFVWDERDQWPTESRCGEIAVRNLLNGGRGHYGPLEHPQIVFNAGWFPHSTMQQIRTHRHLSMDVQSGRYTGQRIVDIVEGRRDTEEVFYLRPVGDYKDRQGKKYSYTHQDREADLEWCRIAAKRYSGKILDGYSEEQARGIVPFDVRQHWVLSCNARTLSHLLTIRGKADAQLECQQLCELMLPHFKAWMPEIYGWFEKNQWQKGRLAP